MINELSNGGLTAQAKISSADYVVVGAGIAGCALAARLQTKLPSASIVLIEAGSDPANNPLATNAAGAPAVKLGDAAWHVDVEPMKGLGGRTYTVHVGKALGGSAAVNGGAWTRGPATDYDLWAETVGDASWNYESMLPYFRMTESYRGVHRDGTQRGYSGPVPATPISANHPKRMYPLREPLKKAWEQAGVKYIVDANNGSPLGISDLQEVWVDGIRPLPGKFLDLSRVTVILDTLVHRITMTRREGRLVATGVDLVDGHHIEAKKEVIVSAGVCHTPKILLLSGIGGRAALDSLSIPVNLDNPEVGQNLMDHLGVAVTWKIKNPERGLVLGSPLLLDPSFANGYPVDFVHFGQAPMAQLAAIATDEDDKKLLIRPDATHIETVFLYIPMEERLTGVNTPMNGEYATTFTVCLTPTSRGYVAISSTNPLDPPVVDINFNATETDRFILREGLRQTASMLRDTEAGRSFVDCEAVPEGHQELLAGASDEAINARIRDFGFSLDHPCGSCAMGKVVDSKCRVMGVEGLRIVDASVFPIPLAAHPQVCVYALAQKAADIIAKADAESA